MNVEQPRAGSRHDRIWALREALAAPRHYVRPWYTAYLLLGVVTGGIIPVLLPMMMQAVAHQLATVAWVMGAYNLGLLSSPLWGLVAERRKAYRSFFVIGLLAVAVGTAALPVQSSLAGWLPVALALGVGSAGAATVATLFIVDFAPREEWEPRIGWLQSFNSTGQVLGLLLASFFSQGHYAAGLWTGGLVVVASMAFAGKGLPMAGPPGPVEHSLHLDLRALAAFPRLHFPSGVSFHFHRFSLNGLKRLPDTTGTPFGRLLLSWFALIFGGAGFFTYFPLMLAKSYGIGAGASSLIYAVVTAAGIGLSILMGVLTARFGSNHVHLTAIGLRLAGFVLLLIPMFAAREHSVALATAGFALIVVAWAVLSVTGTALAARLSPFSQGEAMGLMNAALALAVVAGTLLSGPLVEHFGYVTIPLLGLGGLTVSLVLAAGLPARTGSAAR